MEADKSSRPLGVGSSEGLGPTHDGTYWKVDTTTCQVRAVRGGPWPTKDSEGETCYVNSHFKTQREALEKLRDECSAWLNINGRQRADLLRRLLELKEEDRRARDGLQRALLALA